MELTTTISNKMDQILGSINQSGASPMITELLAGEQPFLKEAKDLYEKEDSSSPARRATVSLIHHIYVKGLTALPISRRIIRETYDNDPNWKTKKPFLDDDYKPFLEIIKGLGIRKITNYSNYKPSIFHVDENCPTSSYFSGDRAEQLKNTFSYCEVTRTSFVNDDTLKEFEKFLPGKSLQS